MPDTREENPYAPPPGFMSKMLDGMPTFVVGLVGSFLGIALSIVIVLKIGGMDVAFSRVVNAYAAGLEASMTRLTAQADKAAATYEDLNAKLDRLNSQLSETTAIVEGSRGRITAIEAQVGTIDARVKQLEQWSCDHEKRVSIKAKDQFGTSACR